MGFIGICPLVYHILIVVFKFFKAWVSALERLLYDLGVEACSNISVVVMSMKVSRVGDLPTGGVNPVGFENWSFVVEFDSIYLQLSRINPQQGLSHYVVLDVRKPDFGVYKQQTGIPAYILLHQNMSSYLLKT